MKRWILAPLLVAWALAGPDADARRPSRSQSTQGDRAPILRYVGALGGEEVWTPHTVTTVSSCPHTVLGEQRVLHVTTLPCTINLRAVATAGAGAWLIIKDAVGTASANPIVIDGSGAETIDGAATYSITEDYGSVEIYTNATAWFVR